jgi:hypothetical protein
MLNQIWSCLAKYGNATPTIMVVLSQIWSCLTKYGNAVPIMLYLSKYGYA